MVYIDKLLDVHDILTIFVKAVSFKCNKFYLSTFFLYLGSHLNSNFFCDAINAGFVSVTMRT